ncbi:hypothetical protein WOLCODRAFT_154992 [Wolfiporia cocos MD-104 SS10]|uniref:Heterokaryon incompatibility domain-containing protein n=1 Tax=Wolfiporia cocos (strain MD-104) TaxID=742152 RepID=A0A2H3JS47_WOLCO|nr:hypothetical protein WOLCODRAFT_154992 [Wolfiporia cocos MD-104 SS10]
MATAFAFLSPSTSIVDFSDHVRTPLIPTTTQKLKEEQLVRTLPTGERVLSCENLSHILAGWRERLDALKGDAPVLQEWHDQIEHTLFGAYNGMMDEFIHAEQNMLHVAGLDHDTIGKNLYMFAAIAEALTISRLFKHYTTLDGTHHLIWSWARRRISDDIYGRDMRARGWCPFTIETFSDRLYVLGYAQRQPPPLRPVLYRSHEDCTPRKCVASNVDPGTYRTRHVSEDCACGFAKPPLAEVMSVISSSQVPVMRIVKDSTPDGGESLCIQCVPSNDTPYVAISHVWADGLGSNTETGLPICQLQRLATMTESLISGGSFWIDSLCVPDESQSRKQAIRMMARTYKEARLVLVIDAGIYSCPVNTPLERKLLAILSSAWLQRLWTLHEALLAKEMKFLFGDKVIDFEDMIIEAGGDPDPVRLPLLLEVSRLWSKRQKIQSGFKLSLSDISRSLQRRTSSRVSDETLAIASLLGVDVHKLVHLDASKRMQALLLELRTIPPNIIFIHDGEKLEIPNFSWAPASFMIDAVASTIEDNGRCTPQGLIAEYECLHIDPVTFDKQGPYYLLDIPEDRGFYLVGVATFDKSKTPTCNALLLEKPPSFDQPMKEKQFKSKAYAHISELLGLDFAQLRI